MEKISPHTTSDIRDEVKALDLGAKIRRLRRRRNLTLQNVSDMTGLSKSLLSQVENNLTAPPIATLLKISRALVVNIGYFFWSSKSDQNIVVVRRDERHGPIQRDHHEVSEMGYLYESLAHPMVDKHMEPFMVEIHPREVEKLQFFNHRGEEFLFVLGGEVEFRGGDRVISLTRGDSIYFDSNIPHALRALGGKPARTLAVVFSQ
ncbi:MAG: cupin domain-containing protein [Desulfobacterales bacterium]|nr:cupin domain-containing protein [Desulfobacterales bacterium]